LRRGKKALARAKGRLTISGTADAEGRDQVLAEVLVLIVAEDHDEVRSEVVERLSHGAEGVDEPPAVLGGRARALIAGPLPPHGLGPRRRVPQRRGHLAARHRAEHEASHRLVGHHEPGVVRQTESEDLPHRRLPLELYTEMVGRRYRKASFLEYRLPVGFLAFDGGMGV
jgi:hypothetical protein